MPSDHPPLSAPDTSLTVTTTPRRLGSRMTAQTGPCAKPSPRPVYSPRATLPKHSSPRNPRIAQPTQAENNQRYSNNQSYSQTLNQLTPSQPTKQPNLHLTMLFKLIPLVLAAAFATFAAANKDNPDPCNGVPLCVFTLGSWVATVHSTPAASPTTVSVAVVTSATRD